jgi:hypothetical protein
MKKSRLFVAASFGSLAMIIASPSFAQTAPAAQEPEEDVVVNTSEVVEDASSAIVVTGSRIRNPNVTSDVPISSISGEVILQTSEQNIGEVLNDLPQLRSTFAQQNP